MESTAMDPSALTFTEKKSLFSAICKDSDCSSPQVGRLNNPFSAPTSSFRNHLEHHYPKYLTASMPGRASLAPARLFAESTAAVGVSGSASTASSASAAAFRRLSRQFSHKLILEAATQTESSVSPAPSAGAGAVAQQLPPSPPQSPDLVALLWRPAEPSTATAPIGAGAGTAKASPPLSSSPALLAGPDMHKAGAGSIGGGPGDEAAVSCAARLAAAPAAGRPDQQPQQLRAVAELLSQFVAHSRARGLPVDPRVAAALRAANLGPQGGQEEASEAPVGAEKPPAVGRVDGVGAVHAEAAPPPLNAPGEGGQGGAEGEALAPPAVAPASGSAAGVGIQVGGGALEVEVAGAAGAAAAWLLRRRGARGGEAEGAAPSPALRADVERCRSSEVAARCTAELEAAAEALDTAPASCTAAASFTELREEARQLQLQLRQRALAQYDNNRRSAAALQRSLCVLQEAAAEAAAVAAPAVPSPDAPSSAVAAPCGGGGGGSGGPAAAGQPGASGEVALRRHLELEQRLRAEMAAQCARLQRQCEGLLSYISMLSGDGRASLAAAVAAPPPLRPGEWLPPLQPQPPLLRPWRSCLGASPSPSSHPAAAPPQPLQCTKSVRVRLVVLPCEVGAVTSAAAAMVRIAAADAVQASSVPDDDEALSEEEMVGGPGGRELPVRVKLRLTVCRRGGGVAPDPMAAAAEQRRLWVAGAAAALGVSSPAPAVAAAYSAESSCVAAAVTDGDAAGDAESVACSTARLPPPADEEIAVGGGSGLKAEVQKPVAAVEEQAAATAADAGGDGSSDAAAAPAVPTSVLDGLRGVLRLLRGGGSGGGAAGGRGAAAAAPLRPAAPHFLHPTGKPPRPEAESGRRPEAHAVAGGRRGGGGGDPADHPTCAPRDLYPELQLQGAAGVTAPATDATTAAPPSPTSKDGRRLKVFAATAEDGEAGSGQGAIDSDGGGAATGGHLARWRSAPALGVGEHADAGAGGEDDDDSDGASPFADALRRDDCLVADLEDSATANAAAARPHAGGRRVPTPPCSPRSFRCSPTSSNDITADLDLDLELADSHVGSGSAAAAGCGASGSGSATGDFLDEGYGLDEYGYGHVYGYGEDLDYADLAEWDELAAAAAANGPAALLGAVGFLREQLQQAQLEIVSLTTQLGSLSHQREGLRARASQRDAALTLLALGEGEALLEAQGLRAALAAERSARARLSAQCEDLKRMLVSGPPQSGGPQGHHQQYRLGSPTKPGLGSSGSGCGAFGLGHPHPHPTAPHQHQHHPSLQRPRHPHPHLLHHHSLNHHGSHNPHQQLQGSQAHQQHQQQLLLLHQQLLLQHQQQHQQQRPCSAQQLLPPRHRSAPRHRATASAVLSARSAGGAAAGGAGSGDGGEEAAAGAAPGALGVTQLELGRLDATVQGGLVSSAR